MATFGAKVGENPLTSFSFGNGVFGGAASLHASHFVSGVSFPSSRPRQHMPHKRSRGIQEARLASHEARQEPEEVYRLPSENPAPSAVLLILESVRRALLTLNRSWLSVAARRLRAILAEVDAILAQPEHDEF